MTLSWRFVTFWLPWLSVISTCAWAILSGVKESTRDRSRKDCEPLDEGTTNAPVAMPAVRQRGERTIWIASMMLMLALGLALGYGARDHELATRTQTYTDVAINKALPGNEFLIWPDRMKQMHIRLCPESSVAWYEGEVLSDWTFEQKSSCKRVVSYHEKPKGEIDAAIQIR